MSQTVILSSCRTPIGSFLGSLSTLKAPQLGAIVIEEALKRGSVDKEAVNEVIMGCVLSAGIGQAPARQAMIYAGLPKRTGAMTINKVCGSGLKAVMLADQAIRGNDAEIVVAGGMESMSNAPHYLLNARTGYRMGNSEVVDGMIYDGLWDIYNNMHMGNCGELCASKYGFSREEQDKYAALSYTRALEAQKNGLFNEEVVAIKIKGKKGDEIVIDKDEEPEKGNVSKLSSLKTPFQKDGTITAGNASTINDGAAAIVLSSSGKANELGLKPVARIIAQASAGLDPEWFTIAPVDAIKKVLNKAGLTLNDIDLFEINEAFSVVAMAAIKQLEIPVEKINVNGGAVSLGHPIGASGARILTTLLYALKARGSKRGLATLCIGGGEASAVIVEML